MDLDRLSEFVTIVQEGSLGKAAKKLSLSPATLGARLHAFEKTLSVTLLEPSNHQARLTPAGERLLPNAEDMLRQYSHLLGEIRAAQRHTYRQLRICLTEMTMPLHLGPFLDRLNATNPDIRLELLDAAQYTISGSLLAGEADLYFATMIDRPSGTELLRYVISGPSPYAILPQEHPLATRGSVRLKELDGERFILYPRSAESCARNFQLTNLNAAGIRYTVYDSDTSGSFASLLVPIGKGVLITPSPVIHSPPSTVSIPLLDVPHPALSCLFCLKAPANPDVTTFLQDYAAFCRRDEKNPSHVYREGAQAE